MMPPPWYEDAAAQIRALSDLPQNWNSYGADPVDHAAIAAAILDDAARGRLEAILTKPEIIGREVARLRRDDPTEADVTAIDRATAELERKRANLSRVIASLDPEDAEPLVRELTGLGAHKRQLEAERRGLMVRRQGWEAALNQRPTPRRRTGDAGAPGAQGTPEAGRPSGRPDCRIHREALG